jgi:hypothetical protein
MKTTQHIQIEAAATTAEAFYHITGLSANVLCPPCYEVFVTASKTSLAKRRFVWDHLAAIEFVQLGDGDPAWLFGIPVGV